MTLEPWAIGLILTGAAGLAAWMTRIAVGLSRLELLVTDVHDIKKDVRALREDVDADMSCLREDVQSLDRRVTRIEPRPA